MTDLSIAPPNLSDRPNDPSSTEPAPHDSRVNHLAPLLAYVRFEVGRLLRSWKFLAITVGFPVIFYILFLGDHTAGRVVDGTVPWRVYLMVSMCPFVHWWPP